MSSAWDTHGNQTYPRAAWLRSEFRVQEKPSFSLAAFRVTVRCRELDIVFKLSDEFGMCSSSKAASMTLLPVSSLVGIPSIPSARSGSCDTSQKSSPKATTTSLTEPSVKECRELEEKYCSDYTSKLLTVSPEECRSLMREAEREIHEKDHLLQIRKPHNTTQIFAN